MKPDPLPPSRPLDDLETLMLQMQSVHLQGARNFAAARRLAKLGLGEIDGRVFAANAAGLAAVADD